MLLLVQVCVSARALGISMTCHEPLVRHGYSSQYPTGGQCQGEQPLDPGLQSVLDHESETIPIPCLPLSMHRKASRSGSASAAASASGASTASRPASGDGAAPAAAVSAGASAIMRLVIAPQRAWSEKGPYGYWITRRRWLVARIGIDTNTLPCSTVAERLSVIRIFRFFANPSPVKPEDGAPVECAGCTISGALRHRVCASLHVDFGSSPRSVRPARGFPDRDSRCWRTRRGHAATLVPTQQSPFRRESLPTCKSPAQRGIPSSPPSA